MGRTNKFKFTLYDEDGVIQEEATYNTLAEITRDYEDISYGSLYYILNYEAGERKPGKNIRELMKRIKIERISNNDMFKKRK